ncbi:MAG: response regulator [Gemmatimonadaceae bacterium]|nr:response regulator [Gemmatimonadaceae bacterium]
MNRDRTGAASIGTAVAADTLTADEMRASEARYRLLAETMLQGVMHHAADGSIIALNPAAERILGRPRAEFLGSHPVQEERNTIREDGTLFPGVEHPSAVAQRTGQPVRGVVMGVFNWERNEYRWLRVDAVPLIRPGEDTPYEVYTVFEDITRPRQVERALREAHTRKDHFIATLAHELRNPLAPIRNAVAVQRLKGYDDPQMVWCTEVIDRQVGHMSRLLDDLLDASRISSGKLDLRRGRVALSAVLHQAIETARPLLDAAQHRLEIRLGEAPVFVDADAMRLAQVFGNLLTNAAKYTEPGGRITVTAAVAGGDLFLRVRDTGIGIAVSDLPRVFEMFGQVESALERSQGGLGIGLSLAKALVTLHGGEITVHSDGPGQGTEFTVRLPVMADEPASPAPSVQGDGYDGAVHRRVLVVDDNRDGCDSLATLLRLSGMDVEVAYDATEAIAAVTRHAPDVALLDNGLPGMNGYELCQVLRSLPGSDALVLVALTGWGSAADRARAERAGFDAHFTKPVAIDELVALLRRPTVEVRRRGAEGG